jgi:hypothetical protein
MELKSRADLITSYQFTAPKSSHHFLWSPERIDKTFYLNPTSFSPKISLSKTCFKRLSMHFLKNDILKQSGCFTLKKEQGFLIAEKSDKLIFTRFDEGKNERNGHFIPTLSCKNDYYISVFTTYYNRLLMTLKNHGYYKILNHKNPLILTYLLHHLQK